MEVRVLDFKDNELNMMVKEEDVGILYILQHELLQSKKVEFAGITLRHPLTKEYEMRIVTESGNPFDAIADSADAAREYIESLAQMLKKVK